jgi:hypothetical protein
VPNKLYKSFSVASSNQPSCTLSPTTTSLMDFSVEAAAYALPLSPPPSNVHFQPPERQGSDSDSSSWSMLSKMRAFKGKDKEVPTKRPLHFLDLPVDILKEIIGHVGSIISKYIERKLLTHITAPSRQRPYRSCSQSLDSPLACYTLHIFTI